MKLGVVGIEPALRKQCEKMLSEMSPENWEILEGSLKKGPFKADVYLIGYEPGHPPVPKAAEHLVKHSLFVVDPAHLDGFREWLGQGHASILLKPVLPAALRPFLEHALGRTGADTGREDNSGDQADELLDGLLHANLKLQEYDQHRTNFLARVVHDFRAPLTAISGYCGLLLEQRLGSLNSEQMELLRRMQHSVNRVTKLSEAMFDLSVRQRKGFEPRLQEADVEAAITQAVHELTPRAEEKQIRISLHLERPLRTLHFDVGKIEQVLVNLLENACKFTPKQGTLDVAGYPVLWHAGSQRSSRRLGAGDESLSKGGIHAYRVDIRDSGSGISQEHLESVFEEYTQYAGSADRSGAGLGLAICRMIVQAHGGKIWAESGPGGAQFSFILLENAPQQEIRQRSRVTALSA